jgi:hypothetical protein
LANSGVSSRLSDPVIAKNVSLLIDINGIKDDIKEFSRSECYKNL